VGVQVLPEVNQILAAVRRGQEGLEGMGDRATQTLFSSPCIPLPVVTTVTFKGPVLAVAKTHVVA
jgi:hypothetical protein